MKFKALLIAYIFAFLNFNNVAYSQKNHVINGTIKDSSNGETLIGASVQVIGATKIGTVTNAYGYYSLSVPDGVYEIVFSYVGYKTITKNISISKDLKQEVSLESANQLMEVVVSSERKNNNVENP